MRSLATCVVVIGLVSISAVGRAQTAPAQQPVAASGSTAGQAYGVPVGATYTPSPATFPLTRYDSRQQSVVIVDEPTAASRPSATGAPSLATQQSALHPTASQQSSPGDIRLASALDPIPAFAPQTYSQALPNSSSAQGSSATMAGPQFQLLDYTKPTMAMPSPANTSSPIAYNTIDGPYLPSPDCYSEGIDYADVPYTFQVLPQGLIWHSYLAGPKEPRFNALLIGGQNVGEKFDGQVGGRVGLLRYGDMADYRPQGVQVDVEGGAIIREDEQEAQLVDGFDFRIGVPVTFGWGNWMMKVSWYHTSAHLGDEFMIANPSFPRINYSRNAIVWGLGYYLPHDVRVYGEVDYGYWTDGGNLPWAFQVGFEYSPDVRALHGAPFLAVNGFLRQENDYGGYFTFETGWQWRGLRAGQLIRAGFLYQNGPNTLNEFFRFSEQQLGGGLWYDF
ncbi:MAG TPA: DUF1207 domain-containing protein [Pirellulales bacterium]